MEKTESKSRCLWTPWGRRAGTVKGTPSHTSVRGESSRWSRLHALTIVAALCLCRVARLEREDENRKQWASEGRTKSQPWQYLTEHRASIECCGIGSRQEGQKERGDEGKLKPQGLCRNTVGLVPVQ